MDSKLNKRVGDLRLSGDSDYLDGYADGLENARQTALCWQPIETAPKDETFVLLLMPNRNVLRAKWVTNSHWLSMHGVELHPTHWMPLPVAPQEASNGS